MYSLPTKVLEEGIAGPEETIYNCVSRKIQRCGSPTILDAG
jgi:hypothetical protein